MVDGPINCDRGPLIGVLDWGDRCFRVADIPLKMNRACESFRVVPCVVELNSIATPPWRQEPEYSIRGSVSSTVSISGLVLAIRVTRQELTRVRRRDGDNSML